MVRVWSGAASAPGTVVAVRNRPAAIATQTTERPRISPPFRCERARGGDHGGHTGYPPRPGVRRSAVRGLDPNVEHDPFGGEVGQEGLGVEDVLRGVHAG